MASQPEVAIEVKGKQRFVVMDMDYYQQLRESELEIAWAQARADIAAGRYSNTHLLLYFSRDNTPSRGVIPAGWPNSLWDNWIRILLYVTESPEEHVKRLIDECHLPIDNT